ncbi:hypothetical protein PRIPAC_86242 [Pristionchus pacificus]|uniref:Uncharacterized protein n=1 Tax=Pristionchus pacificus TaxID=54126 RepID=A0A2A6BS05_PRIPA|nr:hypothetical protein PRIPAC_86242 [Pristionchus pacificus]|eukprot:PDM68606.1 hypothetical protein PRIPAC_46908 [Pristionchus pacificus]
MEIWRADASSGALEPSTKEFKRVGKVDGSSAKRELCESFITRAAFNEDSRRLHFCDISCMLSGKKVHFSFHILFIYSVYGKLNVIDGLNRPDLVANMKQLSGNSVVIWRKDRNLPKQVNTINQEGCQKVKVFQVGSRGEIDDICALIITLFTNGRLYTNDKMRNHLKGFDNYYKDTIVEALLSIRIGDISHSRSISDC